MKRIGLDREQHNAFYPQAHYPATSPVAAGELRRRGYNVPNEEKLMNLVRRGLVATSGEGKAKWTAEAIDQVADRLEEKQDFGPVGVICQMHGLSVADWLEALAVAHAGVLDQFGKAALKVIGAQPDEVHFTCHLEQDRSGIGQGGRIWFSLREDVFEEIQKLLPVRTASLRSLEEIEHTRDELANVPEVVESYGNNFQYGYLVGKLTALDWVLREAPGCMIGTNYTFEDWNRDSREAKQELAEALKTKKTRKGKKG